MFEVPVTPLYIAEQSHCIPSPGSLPEPSFLHCLWVRKCKHVLQFVKLTKVLSCILWHGGTLFIPPSTISVRALKEERKKNNGKEEQKQDVPLGTASTGIEAARFQSWGPILSDYTYSQMPGKADSDWTGCNHSVKTFWRGGEGRRKGERKKRWQMQAMNL